MTHHFLIPLLPIIGAHRRALHYYIAGCQLYRLASTPLLYTVCPDDAIADWNKFRRARLNTVFRVVDKSPLIFTWRSLGVERCIRTHKVYICAAEEGDPGVPVTVATNSASRWLARRVSASHVLVGLGSTKVACAALKAHEPGVNQDYLLKLICKKGPQLKVRRRGG